eukprot:gene17849-biopygen9904
MVTLASGLYAAPCFHALTSARIQEHGMRRGDPPAPQAPRAPQAPQATAREGCTCFICRPPPSCIQRSEWWKSAGVGWCSSPTGPSKYWSAAERGRCAAAGRRGSGQPSVPGHIPRALAGPQGTPQGEQDTGAGVARTWRGRGAGYRYFLAWGGAGVARACPVPQGTSYH